MRNRDVTGHSWALVASETSKETGVPAGMMNQTPSGSQEHLRALGSPGCGATSPTAKALDVRRSRTRP